MTPKRTALSPTLSSTLRSITPSPGVRIVTATEDGHSFVVRKSLIGRHFWMEYLPTNCSDHLKRRFLKPFCAREIILRLSGTIERNERSGRQLP